jgi:hypothetical protein
MTIEQIAAVLRVSPNRIPQWIKNGDLPWTPSWDSYDLRGWMHPRSVGMPKPKRDPEPRLTGFDFNRPARLYYLRVTLGEKSLYKIGVANKTVKRRYNAIRKFVPPIFTGGWQSCKANSELFERDALNKDPKKALQLQGLYLNPS